LLPPVDRCRCRFRCRRPTSTGLHLQLAIPVARALAVSADDCLSWALLLSLSALMLLLSLLVASFDYVVPLAHKQRGRDVVRVALCETDEQNRNAKQKRKVKLVDTTGAAVVGGI